MAAFEKNCTSCHDAAQANVHRTRVEWERVIEDMVTRGANGSGQDLDVIATYLSRFFGKNYARAATGFGLALFGPSWSGIIEKLENRIKKPRLTRRYIST